MTFSTFGWYIAFLAVAAACLAFFTVKTINRVYDFSRKVDTVLFLVVTIAYFSAAVWVVLSSG